MRLKEWQTSLICEICMVGGSNGINLTTFWSFVEELKPKHEKELVSVNEMIEFEDFEEKEVVEKELIIGDDFKAWFWKEFVNLEQVILRNEEKTANSAQLKLNTYQEIEKNYSAVVVIIEEKIRDQIIYKNVDPEKVTKEWKELLYYICKHRYSGVLTTDLSDVFKKDAKTIFTRVKELVNLGLIVRHPIVRKKKTTCYTNIQLHSYYASRNIFLVNMDDDVELEQGEIQNLDNFIVNDDDIDISISNQSVKKAIHSFFKDQQQEVFPLKDLYRKLKLHDENYVFRKRIRRIIQNMVRIGYLQYIAIHKENGTLIDGIRKLKDFNIDTDVKIPKKINYNEPIDSQDSNLHPNLPFEHQIYQIIKDSGEKGILTSEISKKMMGLSERILLNLLSILVKEKEDDDISPCVKAYEFEGKKRMLRFFTKEAFESKKNTINSSNINAAEENKNISEQIEENTDITTNEQKKENEITEQTKENVTINGQTKENIPSEKNKASKSKKIARGDIYSLTKELRNRMLLDVLEENKIIKFDVRLLNLVQQKLKSHGIKSDLDRKTLMNSIKSLQLEKKVAKLEIEVPHLNGTTENVTIIHLYQFDNQQLIINSFVQDVCNNSRFLTTKRPLVREVIYNFENKERGDIIEDVDYINSMNKIQKLTKLVKNESKENTIRKPILEVATNFDHWLTIGQKLGLLKTILLRIKTLHVHLIECLSLFDDKYQQTRLLPPQVFFQELKLEVLLAITPISNINEDLVEYCGKSENRSKLLKDIDKEKYKELIQPNLCKKTLKIVKYLTAMGLLFKVNLYNFDQMIVNQPYHEIVKQELVNKHVSFFYYLPNKYEHVMDILKVMNQYCLETVQDAILFWTDLEYHAGNETLIKEDKDKDKDKDKNKDKNKENENENIINKANQVFYEQDTSEMTRCQEEIKIWLNTANNWTQKYTFNVFERGVLNSYIDIRRKITPLNDSNKINELADTLKIPTANIRSYYYILEKKFKSIDNSDNIKKKLKESELIKKVLDFNNNNNNNNNNNEIINKKGNKKKKIKKFNNIDLNDMEFSNEEELELLNQNYFDQYQVEYQRIRPTTEFTIEQILLGVTILQFRFHKERINYSFPLQYFFPKFSKSAVRTWLKSTLNKQKYQLELLKLMEIWKQIYIEGVKDKSLIEKEFTEGEGEGEEIIHQPINPKENDPYSYLPNKIALNFNFQEQFKYFESKLKTYQQKEQLASFKPLPSSIQEVNENYNINLHRVLNLFDQKETYYYNNEIQSNYNIKQIMQFKLPNLISKIKNPLPFNLNTLNCFIETSDTASLLAKNVALMNFNMYSSFGTFNLDDPTANLCQQLTINNNNNNNKLIKINPSLELTLGIIRIILLMDKSSFDFMNKLTPLLLNLDPRLTEMAIKQLVSKNVICNTKRISNQLYENELIQQMHRQMPGKKLDYILSDKFILCLNNTFPKKLIELGKNYYNELISKINQQNKMEFIITPLVTPSNMLVLLSLIAENKIELELPIINIHDEVRNNEANIKSTNQKLKVKEENFIGKFNLGLENDDNNNNNNNNNNNAISNNEEDISNFIIKRQINKEDNELTLNSNKRSKVRENPIIEHNINNFLLTISDKQLQQQVKLIYEFIKQFEVNGITKILIIKYFKNININDIEMGLNLLMKYNPPLIYIVGSEISRIISYEYFNKWATYIGNRRNKINKNQKENEVLILPKPWLNYEFKENKDVYNTYKLAVCKQILRYPGISKRILHKNLELLITMVELELILEKLLNDNLIFKEYLIQPKKKVNLFSKRLNLKLKKEDEILSKEEFENLITIYFTTLDFYKRV